MQLPLRLLASTLFIFITISLSAQSSLSVEYKLELIETKVDLDEIEGLEQMGQLKNMMESARYRVMFKGEKSRIEIKSLLISMIMVTDYTEGKSLILTSALGDKSAQLIEGEDYSSLSEMREDTEDKVEFGNSSKKLAGYTCKDAKISKADGTVTTVWYCPDLKGNESPLNRFQSPLIDGLILQMDSEFNGIKVRFKADEVSKDEIDDKYLGFGIPKGYELKKPEFSQLKNGL
jgi:GLPGLI family protein